MARGAHLQEGPSNVALKCCKSEALFWVLIQGKADPTIASARK